MNDAISGCAILRCKGERYTRGRDRRHISVCINIHDAHGFTCKLSVTDSPYGSSRRYYTQGIVDCKGLFTPSIPMLVRWAF